MSCRKPCSECPHRNTNNHSIKFRTYNSKMKTIGKEKQACHMITKDVWGYNTEITDKNICVGSQQDTLK